MALPVPATKIRDHFFRPNTRPKPKIKSHDNKRDLLCAYCIAILSFKYKTHSTFPILDCVGPLKPEVVQSTAYNSNYPASSVLILGEEAAVLGNGKTNYWLAEEGKTTGQGFTLKLDTCARLIAGCQIKNTGKKVWYDFATKGFKISGSMIKNGPWETLVEDQLVETSWGEAAPLLNFTFDKPVEIQFIMFDLISYWGDGGGLQYFAAIPATSKKHQFCI